MSLASARNRLFNSIGDAPKFEVDDAVSNAIARTSEVSGTASPRNVAAPGRNEKRYAGANARSTGANDSHSACRAAQYLESNGARPIWTSAPRQSAGPGLSYSESTSYRSRPRQHIGNFGTCTFLPAKRAVMRDRWERNSPRGSPELECCDRLLFSAAGTFWGVGGPASGPPSGNDAANQLRVGTRPKIFRRNHSKGATDQSTRRCGRRALTVGRKTNLVRIVRGAQHPLALTVIQRLHTARQLGNSANRQRHMSPTLEAAGSRTPQLQRLGIFGRGFVHFAPFTRQRKRPHTFKGFGQPMVDRGNVGGQRGQLLLALFGTQA